MVKKIIAFLLLVLCAGVMNAQLDKLRQAFVCTQAGKLDSAKMLIDAASKNAETMNDAQTWYVKGFIYKELFKKRQPASREIPIAGEAFEACKKAISLDTSAETRQTNLSIIKSLTALVNNTFGETLDTVNYKKSMECIELQKPLVKYLKPKANIDSIEVYYYGIMGSYFQTAYEKNPKKNTKYLKLAEDSYNKVLIKEPNNVSANYNMGIIYYNQAVSLIMNKLDYDFDLATLNDIQDEAVNWFKKSLPFMEKAYQLNPRRRETLIGLSGIYYSLHDNEKSQQFQKLSQDLEKQK
jgi:hypothetical protein